MISEFINTFDKREGELEEFFAAHEPKSYYDIVFAVVQLLHGNSPLLPEVELAEERRRDTNKPNCGEGLPNPLEISEINDAEWCGSLIYLIPADISAPTEDDYWFCSVSYGSCPFCDPLQQVWGQEDKNKRVDDYMYLAIGVLEGLKSLNGGSFYGNAPHLSWFAKDLVVDAEARQDGIAGRLSDAALEAQCSFVEDKVSVGDRVRYETLSILARQAAVSLPECNSVISEAVSDVKSALRFAFILPLDCFAEHYQVLHDAIGKQGFTLLSSDNRFVNNDDVLRIGIIAYLQDADGFTFEVQFHTRDSYDFALATGQFMRIATHLDAQQEYLSGAGHSQLLRLRESIGVPDDIHLSSK